MYLKSNENNYIKIDDEKESLISDEKSKKNINNNNNEHTNKLMNLFDIIYNDDNKYFQLVKRIIIKIKEKKISLIIHFII